MGRDGRGLRSRGAAPLPLRTPFVSCFSTSLSCLNFLPKSRAPGVGTSCSGGSGGPLVHTQPFTNSSGTLRTWPRSYLRAPHVPLCAPCPAGRPAPRGRPVLSSDLPQFLGLVPQDSPVSVRVTRTHCPPECLWWPHGPPHLSAPSASWRTKGPRWPRAGPPTSRCSRPGLSPEPGAQLPRPLPRKPQATSSRAVRGLLYRDDRPPPSARAPRVGSPFPRW